MTSEWLDRLLGSDGFPEYLQVWTLAVRDLLMAGVELSASDVETLGQDFLITLGASS